MMGCIEQMRVKGIHFDQGGDTWPLEKLQELGGLFEFRDIWERLPFPKKRVQGWIKNRQQWPGIFHRFPTGKARSTTYIDLEAFLDSPFIRPVNS